ncbi:PREDICTED: membrane steroid-binding protein 2-like isoform X2 [Nicotiana attenuata]|uniref:Membrane steroid-binding protein 2 n=1 Tax=Nicotiana attenuata TaxID=49451 RepID=A0A1J6JTE4_NICAT|nr:PREDICTED: membrane steroid-binding protein 2-like isoform X2 [Nicotiana attenuata]OIT20994.1 membrane steroid-binding protein 2 [Nicotiana attenuata]
MASVWTSMTETILEYTGLSSTAFFTIAAMMVVTYKVVCSMFVSADDFVPVKREPLHLGDLTEEELKAYNGSDSQKPLLIAIRGQIYDVSSSKMFYGPGGPYAMFAGRDASRALAQLSFKPQDINGNLEGLSDAELEILRDWEDKFIEKYARVGQLVPKKTLTEKEKDENASRIEEVLKATKVDMMQEGGSAEVNGVHKAGHL